MFEGTGALGWLVFAGTVLTVMLGDRLVFGRLDDSRLRTAIYRSILWVAVGVGFSGCVYMFKGPTGALDYLVAYLVEKLLSVDNLFVFLVIFRYFGLSQAHQHRVLFFGVAGAVVMRAIFILAGAAALHHFHWTMYIFGAFLVFTGVKLAISHEAEMDPSENLALQLGRRFLRVSDTLDRDHFFTRLGTRLYVTPLFLVLLVVEFTDVLFAVDSVPAVLAITDDIFVVYASNVFAILGLRALYFVLADAMGKFSYLGLALSVILVFIGAKMLLSDVFKLPNTVSLLVIVVTLGVAIAASLYKTNSPRSSKSTPPG